MQLFVVEHPISGLECASTNGCDTDGCNGYSFEWETGWPIVCGWAEAGLSGSYGYFTLPLPVRL
jgi:hypothetical protein